MSNFFETLGTFENVNNIGGDSGKYDNYDKRKRKAIEIASNESKIEQEMVLKFFGNNKKEKMFRDLVKEILRDVFSKELYKEYIANEQNILTSEFLNDIFNALSEHVGKTMKGIKNISDLGGHQQQGIVVQPQVQPKSVKVGIKK